MIPSSGTTTAPGTPAPGPGEGREERVARQYRQGELGTSVTGPSMPWAGLFNFPDINWEQIVALARKPSPGLDAELIAAKERRGLGLQEIGTERGALARQLPLLQGQYDIQQGRFGLTEQGVGLTEQQLGIERGGLARQAPLLQRMFGIDVADFARQAEQATYGARREEQEKVGEAAAAGALTTGGTDRRLGDIRQRLAGELGRIGLARQGRTLQYGEDRRQVADALARNTIDRRRLSLEKQGINLDRREAQLMYGEERKKIADGLKLLDLKAKELNIPVSEAARRLKGTMQQAQLDRWMTVADLLSGMTQMRMTQVNTIFSLAGLGAAPPGWKPKAGPASGGGARPKGKWGVTPEVATAGQEIASRFGVAEVGGFADRNVAGTRTRSDHAYGKALDFGVRGAQGNQLAQYVMSNARRLNIKYVVWSGRIWNPDRAGEGWRIYRGQNPHTDHVHVSFK